MVLKYTKLIDKTISELLLTLLPAYTACAQQSRCGPILRAMCTQLVREIQEAYAREREATKGHFLFHNLPLVVHTKLKTSRNVAD